MTILGLNATGTIKYTLSGLDSVTVGGTSYPADIMRIDGNLTASSLLLGVPYTLSAKLGGLRFESRNELSVLREDSLQWVNISIGTGPILLTRVQTEINTSYSPPYMSKFFPSEIGPGDSWTEVTSLTKTTIVNGTVETALSRPTSYLFKAASSMETITVVAGTFNVLRITVTDDLGARTVYWWSSEVANFVLEKRYDALGSQPYTILSLKKFDSSSGEGILVALIIGAAVVAVAVVILAFILKARRRRQPVGKQQRDAGLVRPIRGVRPPPPGATPPG